MIVIVRLALLSLLLCPVAALGQSKFNVCTVLSSWWDKNAAFGTSNDLLGDPIESLIIGVHRCPIGG